MKKYLMTAAACFTLLLTGCDKANENSMSYEKPLLAMKSAANFGDEESYLSCWLPQEKAKYRIDGKAAGFLAYVFDRNDHESRLRIKIRSAREMDETEIAELESDAHARYGTHLSFSKAQLLSVDFRVQDNMDILSDSREMTVVLYKDAWFIYGDIVEQFNFARS